MKKKIYLTAICITAIGSVMTNYSVSAQEDYQTIVEAYKTLFLPLDQGSYQYDCALETVDDYIEGKISLSEATETVNNTINLLKLPTLKMGSVP